MYNCTQVTTENKRRWAYRTTYLSYYVETSVCFLLIIPCVLVVFSVWEKVLGGFLALGLSTIVGIVFLVVIVCTGICVTLCICTCCKKRCGCCKKYSKSCSSGVEKVKTKLASATRNRKTHAGKVGNKDDVSLFCVSGYDDNMPMCFFHALMRLKIQVSRWSHYVRFQTPIYSWFAEVLRSLNYVFSSCCQ